MKTKNIIIIILSCIITLTLLGVFYIYSKNLKILSELSDYMPQETTLYAEFDLKNEKLDQFCKNNFRGQTRFKLLLNQSKFFGNLSKDLIEQADKIALIIIKNNNGQEYNQIWLIRTNNIYNLNGLLPVNFYSSTLDSKTIALSSQRQVLKLIKKDNLLRQTSKQKDILNQFSTDNFINIYISGQYLTFLKDKPDPLFSLILNNVNLNFDQLSFLGLSARNNQIAYNFSANKINGKDYKNFKPADQNILSALPVNDLFLISASANLADVFNQTERQIISQDKKNEWSEKYGFDWQELNDFLSNLGIVFIQIKKDKIETQDIFNLDKYNYGIIINIDNETEIIKFKEKIRAVVKNILAFRYPSEKIKYLRDGSRTTELIAEPNKFIFKKDKDDNNLEYIQEKDFNFVIGYQDNYLILGNDKELIDKILNNKDSDKTSGFFSKYDGLRGQELIVINTNQFTNGLLSYVDQIIINVKEDENDLLLEGWLIW